MSTPSPLEEFWSGNFGDQYTNRNTGADLVAANTALFSRVFQGIIPPQKILELGANIGLNLVALHHLFPQAELHAVEVNAKACDELRALIPPDHVTEGSILAVDWGGEFDLVLLKTVLIHIAPFNLPSVYRRAVESTSRHLLVCEYYSPTPAEVTYRGHSERLFKRDFCGEILDIHPEMRLVDYGFSYHRDPSFPLDDITWFLLERRGA